MKPPKITCRCCRGSGEIDLPNDLFATLKQVRSARKPVGTEDLMEPGIGRTAIANRLRELERNGLVVKAGKRGKEILWMNAEPIHETDREIEELRAAVMNLRDVKGRHHTQQATERLFALLPLTGENTDK